MNSTDFRSLVKNFTALTPEEYTQLENLSSSYPYSQLLHVLRSRASKDLVDKDHITLLHRTAIYSTDRGVVKWAMTTPTTKRHEEAMAVPVPVTVSTLVPVLAPVSKAVSSPKSKDSQPHEIPVENATSAKSRVEDSLQGDALRDDLALELNKLQRLKHDFEVSYETLKHSLQGEQQPASNLEPVQEPPLIEEIKAIRKKLKVTSVKATEQHEIIDQFMKTRPTMPKAKPAVPDADLAEDSVNYTDNIVSETLVAILVKQGKRVKAIEMLKKLIWKFPQKKAKFAAQIEELKN